MLSNMVRQQASEGIRPSRHHVGVSCGARHVRHLQRVAHVSTSRNLAPLDSVRQIGTALTQIAVSDGEVALLEVEQLHLPIIEHMRLLGRLAHLFNRDRIEIAEKGFAGPAHGGLDDPLQQH
jgi:hypothetical protein